MPLELVVRVGIAVTALVLLVVVVNLSITGSFQGCEVPSTYFFQKYHFSRTLCFSLVQVPLLFIMYFPFSKSSRKSTYIFLYHLKYPTTSTAKANPLARKTKSRLRARQHFASRLRHISG